MNKRRKKESVQQRQTSIDYIEWVTRIVPIWNAWQCIDLGYIFTFPSTVEVKKNYTLCTMQYIICFLIICSHWFVKKKQHNFVVVVVAFCSLLVRCLSIPYICALLVLHSLTATRTFSWFDSIVHSANNWFIRSIVVTLFSTFCGMSSASDVFELDVAIAADFGLVKCSSSPKYGILSPINSALMLVWVNNSTSLFFSTLSFISSWLISTTLLWKWFD